MKRVLVFLATNALLLSAFMPAPGKSQTAFGKQGPSPQAAPHIASAMAIHAQDNPTTLPLTVGGAIANNEFYNKLVNRASGIPSRLRLYGINGIGQFHISDGYLNIPRLKEHTGWRDTWNMIIPGNFGDFDLSIPDKWTDLFFYDAVAGQIAFYVTNDSGEISQRGNTLPARNNWHQIIPGEFGGDDRTDLLFFTKDNNAPNGITGEIYTTDGNGSLIHLRSWKPGTGWDLLIPGNFGNFDGSTAAPDRWTDILFYSKTSGVADIYAIDGSVIAPGDTVLGNNSFRRLRSHSLVNSDGIFTRRCDRIAAGNFGGAQQGRADKWTDIVCYSKTGSGKASFKQSDGSGNLFPLAAWIWGTGYDLIVPGNFGNAVPNPAGEKEEPDDWTDLILYSQSGSGTADISIVDGEKWSTLNNFSRRKRHEWGPGYDLIIPIAGNLGGALWTDLLHYSNGN